MNARDNESQTFEKTHRDLYKVQQLKMMQELEYAQPEDKKYGAHLTHWSGNAKPINIDEGALEVLIDYYSGDSPYQKILRELREKLFDADNRSRYAADLQQSMAIGSQIAAWKMAMDIVKKYEYGEGV